MRSFLELFRIQLKQLVKIIIQSEEKNWIKLFMILKIIGYLELPWEGVSLKKLTKP